MQEMIEILGPIQHADDQGNSKQTFLGLLNEKGRGVNQTLPRQAGCIERPLIKTMLKDSITLESYLKLAEV